MLQDGIFVQRYFFERDRELWLSQIKNYFNKLMMAFNVILLFHIQEDNFPGFTPSEVGTPPDKELCEAFNDGDFSPLFELPTAGKVSTRMECTKRGLEALPQTERSRHRLTSVVRKSYLDMHRGTVGSQRKTHAITKKVQDVKGKDALNRVKNVKMKAKDKIPKVMGQLVVPAKTQEKDKPKAIRFRFKLMRGGKRAKILSSPEKQALNKKAVKVSGKAKKNKAKELLAKARQRKVQKVSPDKAIMGETVVEGKRNVKISKKLAGMMVTGVADMHFLHRTTSPPPGGEQTVQSPPSSPTTFTSPSGRRKGLVPSPSPARMPRQFVLPQKSSRSSRVIKPSKRFIEEMGVSSPPPPPSKQAKLDFTSTREVKQELLLSSGEEFVSPDGAQKTLLKQKVPDVSSSKKELFRKPKTTKIVSTKVKKLHSEKHVKTSKAAQLSKKSQEADKEVELHPADKVDLTVKVDHVSKTSKAFKLNSEKVKLIEKKRKEKIKSKKKKLQEKKQKKLEAKKKKKKALKKSKSPKKKDLDKMRDDGIRSGAEADKEDEDGIEDVQPKKDKKSKKDKETGGDKKDKTVKETLDRVKKAKESPSKLLTAVMDIKGSPRKVRKSMKRKLKEEAKQLKKSYSELKKSIDDAQSKPVSAEQDGEERIPILEALDDLQRKNRLKELAKRHKEVCKALKKFQKDNIPEIGEKSKEGKKKKKKDREHSKNLADKILKKAKERIGMADTALQMDITRDQKENMGPLKSPTATELLAAKSAALVEGGSSKAIADLSKYDMLCVCVKGGLYGISSMG